MLNCTEGGVKRQTNRAGRLAEWETGVGQSSVISYQFDDNSKLLNTDTMTNIVLAGSNALRWNRSRMRERPGCIPTVIVGTRKAVRCLYTKQKGNLMRIIYYYDDNEAIEVEDKYYALHLWQQVSAIKPLVEYVIGDVIGGFPDVLDKKRNSVQKGIQQLEKILRQIVEQELQQMFQSLQRQIYELEKLREECIEVIAVFFDLPLPLSQQAQTKLRRKTRNPQQTGMPWLFIPEYQQLIKKSYQTLGIVEEIEQQIYYKLKHLFPEVTEYDEFNPRPYLFGVPISQVDLADIPGWLKANQMLPEQKVEFDIDIESGGQRTNLQRKVLIIAEDYNIIFVHERMFKHHGYEVQICIDFEILLEQTKNFLPSVIYWYYKSTSSNKAREYITEIRQVYKKDKQPIIVIGLGYRGRIPEEFFEVADMVVDIMDTGVQFFTDLAALIESKGLS